VEPGLILKAISFSYGDHWSLEGISFGLNKGELVGIIGPNGSGKSTLLKIMDGLITADKGEILLVDRPLASYRRHEVARQIAMVPQETTFHFAFSVLEVVLMGRFAHRGLFPFEGKEDLDIAREAMQRTGTLDLEGRSIHELSGGEKQRVLIARALTQKTQFILLDEPTSQLDIRHKVEIFELISSLIHTQGFGAVVVSHDISLAAQYCHRMLLLNEGRMHRIGSPNEVVTTDTMSEVYQCPVLVDKNPVTQTPRVTVLSRRAGHRTATKAQRHKGMI
jgi:iron complex transport system ATP-binding protein